MKIICDTHVLVFYAEGSDKLSEQAKAWLEKGKKPYTSLFRHVIMGNRYDA